jgi:hypothetical protein
MHQKQIPRCARNDSQEVSLRKLQTGRLPALEIRLTSLCRSPRILEIPMIRRFLTLLLLLPLSLNGMWMVCAEAEASESAPPAAATPEGQAAASAVEPACSGNVMCPLHKPTAQASSGAVPGDDPVMTASSQGAASGAICLLSLDGASTSIAAVGFVYAPPAPALTFEAAEEIAAAPTEFSSITHADAPLANATPPPRA